MELWILLLLSSNKSCDPTFHLRPRYRDGDNKERFRGLESDYKGKERGLGRIFISRRRTFEHVCVLFLLCEHCLAVLLLVVMKEHLWKQMSSLFCPKLCA